jgi:hypothetical protein
MFEAHGKGFLAVFKALHSTLAQVWRKTTPILTAHQRTPGRASRVVTIFIYSLVFLSLVVS